MSINVAQASSQARHLRELSDRLRDAQSSLLMYQRNLNSGWRGIEMTPVNSAIDSHVQRFDAIVDEMRAVANDIVIVAEIIRREEEAAALAQAQAHAQAQAQARGRGR